YHNTVVNALIPVQAKLGYSSSTPIAGTVLRGTGAGTSAWLDANPTITVANEGSTGTLANGLAKLTGSPSMAIRTSTSDTGGAIGIVTAGAGTSSNATIQVAGIASCVFSGGTTAGNYAVISDATAGNCKDGGSTYPTSGQVIGRVLGTSGGPGTYPILLFAPEIRGGSGGGGGGATTALDNLAGVAINTSLLPGTTDAGDLGSNSKAFPNQFLSRYSDWKRITTPANPPSGSLRLFANDSTGKLACLDASGADCMPSGGGGGGSLTGSGTSNRFAKWTGTSNLDASFLLREANS